MHSFFLFLSGEGPPDPWIINEIVGKDAPLFTLRDLEGREVSLTDYRGKVVLLSFWATWCPPCLSELRMLKELKDIYSNNKFGVIAVATDKSLSKVQDFVNKNNISCIILHDPEIKVSRKYKVFSLPTSFLINKRGKIVEVFFGEQPWTTPEIRKRIEELF